MGEKEFLATLSELLDKKIDVIVTEKIPAVLEEALEYSLLPKLNIILDAKLEARFAEQNAKFEARFAQIEARLAQIDDKFEFYNANLEASFSRLESEIFKLQDAVKDINLRLDNEIMPNIRLLSENYVPAAKRYEAASDEIIAIRSDVDLLKIVVSQHSKRLEQMA